MSYSIQFRESSKEAAKQRVGEEFDKQVLAYQPSHELDKKHVLAHAHAMIDLLGDMPEGHVIDVQMYGSLSWHWGDTKPHGIGNMTSASSTCSACFILQPKA